MLLSQRVTGFLLAATLGLAPLACGPSQEDYDNRGREIEKLKSALSAEQDANKKAQRDLQDAQARIEQLKEQLKSAGVDISNLNANLEQQARALEDYKPQMVYVSAGFDAHRDDPLAYLKLDDADYRWVTEKLLDVAGRHAEGRVVSTLEGGYNTDALARCVVEHVSVLAQ